MKRRVPIGNSSVTGFSLVEILVAVGVLILLLTVLTSVLSGVSNAWQLSREKLDNFAKGRALLNTISRDLANSVVRQDLPAFPQAAGQLSFFTRTFAQNEESDSARPLTYVSYTLGRKNDSRVILRKDAAYDFVASSVPWQPFGTNAVPVLPGPPLERVLCQDVFAFGYNFIQADGTSSGTYHDNAHTNATRAVRVAIAVLNERASDILRAAGREDELAADLQGVTSAGGSLKAGWDGVLTNGSLASKYPRPVLAGLRTYERINTLTTTPLQIRERTP